MQELVQNRIVLLKKEFETGQARLKDLEAELAFVRETLLRISGAIQVLQEIVDESKPAKPQEVPKQASAAGV